MINEPLFAFKLSLTFLIVYPEVLIFNLKLVVELLNFTEMFRIIFDGECFSQLGQFIFQAFVVVAKISNLFGVLLLGKLM